MKEVVFPPKFDYVEKWLFRDCDSLEKLYLNVPGILIMVTTAISCEVRVARRSISKNQQILTAGLTT